MSKKKILTIECELSAENSHYVDFDSDISLLDWDIIIFKPDIVDFVSSTKTYQGKPSLYESTSFRLKERAEHWRREIAEAFKAGKTIFVILSKLQEVFIDTGERQYSGTGRNQKVTTIVTQFNNYESLPISLYLTSSKGQSMKLAHQHSDILANYWKEFENQSEYKVLLPKDIKHPSILTKKGDKVVGAVIRRKESSGAIILLPHINFYKDSFYKNTKSGAEWSKEGISFGARYASALVEIDKALKRSTEITPTPEWAKDQTYVLLKEKKISQQLLRIEQKLEKLQSQKQKTIENLSVAGRSRALLYEKGKPLEYAIIDTLNLIGFKASAYRDTESEFDVVFEGKEGRFLGEAEGKDNKAINIDKLRQLEMNIHEDFSRDEVVDIAKGVLFGNAYRLQPVEDRSDYFTEKCLTAADRLNVALVRTTDLFVISKYLSDRSDKRFATKCRKVLLEGKGIINFPKVPEIKPTISETVIKNTVAPST